MGDNRIVVLPLDGEEASEPFLLEGLAEAIPADVRPHLLFLPRSPITQLRDSEVDAPQGVMFLGMALAKRPTEVGRLTDLDLWNPREYKHDLLMPWHRPTTKAKKQGTIPPHARALFLHHEADVSPDQLANVLLPMVRRIGLWTRFWNNQQRKKASAS